MAFDLQPLWDWFRVLHETSGIKLTIFYDAFDRARFLSSFLTSVRLMGLCLVASVIIGVVGAYGLTRVTRSLLFGVSPTDPFTYIAVAGVITGVALVACVVPAQRAMRVDPVVAIRAE